MLVGGLGVWGVGAAVAGAVAATRELCVGGSVSDGQEELVVAGTAHRTLQG